MAPDLKEVIGDWVSSARLVMHELTRLEKNDGILDKRTGALEKELAAIKVQVKLLWGLFAGTAAKVISDWIGTKGP